MYFIISIDTEEDNWDNFTDKPTLHNIERIEIIQKLFDRFNIKPTYLITYPVANDEKSISVLKPILDSNRCEIGTHLHPWNTPPVEENLIEKNTMLNNLEKKLQFRKLTSLHDKIKKSFGIESQSFRAGRYGLNNDLVENLINLKYKIESSITPFLDWRFFHGPDYSNYSRLNPYWISPESTSEENINGEIIEVPLSIGFLQKNYNFANNLFNILKKTPIKYFKLIGLLSKFNLLNKIRLTPEGYNIEEMKKLVDTLILNGIKVFNLSFHSNTLLPGLTPFVASEKEFNQFLMNLENIIIFFKELNVESITLSQIPKKLNMEH